MAQRRMFAKTVTNSSRFLRMPASSRLLYYDLGMNADDDGYTEWFTVIRMTGATEQDMEVLQANGMVKVFDDKVLIILNWKENNYIQKDRYTPSKYLDVYKMDTERIHVVHKMDTQDRLGKDRLGKDTEIQNTEIQLEDVANAPELTYWKEKTFTTIRSKYPENIKAAHRLKEKIGSQDFARAVETIPIIRADKYAGKTLHQVGNYIQLEKHIEAVEAYRVGIENRDNFDLRINRKKMVSI